jgi:DNA-binding CsgD family transcriptional regulator
MSLSIVTVSGVKVAFCLRSAMVREGMIATIARLYEQAPELRVADVGNAALAIEGTDLLISDVDAVPRLLSGLPPKSFPRRMVALSAADSPAELSPLLRDNACACLSLRDDEGHVALVLRQALRCADERFPLHACSQCPLPRTLEPRALPLSPRERDVFLMIGRGMGAAETALALGISIKTFETHRERIKLKLGLASANDLVVSASAWRRGLFSLCALSHAC